MAAHLRSLVHKCLTCAKPATQELYSTTNDPLGKYCKPCGDKALKRLWDNSPEQSPYGYKSRDVTARLQDAEVPHG